MIKKLCVMMLVLFTCGTVFAADSDLKIGTNKAGVTVDVDRVITDGKALVSAYDATMMPVLGLGIQDFTVNKGNQEGRVVSVQSVAEVVDVPVNIVLVLDNSYSMYERKAIDALLAGLDKLLKVVPRSIDQVSMVVFDNKITTKVGNRDMRVKTFTSNDPVKLREFAKNAYSQKGLTPTTVLYEGMLAGLDIIKKLPADNPRIMIVFTDGEDLNSAVKEEDVAKSSKEIGKLNAYAIDYRESPKTDKFLTQFTKDNHGQIWKAKDQTTLKQVWEDVSAAMDYSYILTYIFPPPDVPKLPEQVIMIFDEVALFDFDKADLKPAGKEQIKAYREQATQDLSRADKIKISGHTDNKGTADYNLKLSMRRAEAVRDYLKSIGVDPNKMEVIGEGMSRPIADNRTAEGRAKNRRVEIEVFGLEKVK